ncbi:MAG: DUF3352 domain-containing protein [Cyanobacteria bacterium HKST-UBA03]|nr:DUF3352 domain-containing protein [Cyanobacteria bacterium HKST-UBA03]
MNGSNKGSSNGSKKQQSGFRLSQLTLPFIASLVVLVVGSVAYVMAQNPTATMVTDHWRYYPANTAMYVELDADAQTVTTLLNRLETLASNKQGAGTPKPSEIYTRFFTPKLSFGVWLLPDSSVSDKQPNKQLTTPDGSSAEKAEAGQSTLNPAEAGVRAAQAAARPATDHSPFRQSITKSVTPTPEAADTEDAHQISINVGAPGLKEKPGMMVVLTTKPGFDMATFLDAAKGPSSEIEWGDAQTVDGKPVQTGEIWAAKDNTRGALKSAFALVGNQLLITPTQADRDTALATVGEGQSFVRSPKTKDMLMLLPQQRRGTLIMASEQFEPLQQIQTAALKGMAGQSKAGSQFIDFEKYGALLKDLNQLTPYTVGAIQWQGQQVAMDFWTPMHLDKISDPNVRDALMAVMMRQSDLDFSPYLKNDTVFYAAGTGLGQLFDLYHDHLASAGALKQLEQVQQQLKVFNLDLRTHFVGLFDGASAVAINPDVFSQKGQAGWQVFLNYNDQVSSMLEQFQAFGQLPDVSKDIAVAQQPYGPLSTMTTVTPVKPKSLPFALALINVDKDSLMIGPKTVVETAMRNRQLPAKQLSSVAQYRQLMTGMPKQKNGVYFLNMSQLHKLAQAAFINDINKATKSDSPPVGPEASNGVKLKAFSNFIDLVLPFDSVLAVNAMESDKMMRSYVRFKLSDKRPATR